MTEQDIYERYVERAAIMEFDGGLTREAASQTVFNLVGRWCKSKGFRFPQLIRDDFKTVLLRDRKVHR